MKHLLSLLILLSLALAEGNSAPTASPAGGGVAAATGKSGAVKIVALDIPSISIGDVTVTEGPGADGVTYFDVPITVTGDHACIRHIYRQSERDGQQ
jgi:hypothetical protein